MGRAVTTRSCWRCRRPVADDAAMCRSCGTAMPPRSHSVPQAGSGGDQWVSGGPGDRAEAPAPRAARPSLGKTTTVSDDGPTPGFSATAWPDPAGSTPGPPTSDVQAGTPKPLRGVGAALVVLFSVEVLALLVNGYARFQEAGLVADIERSPRAVSVATIDANADLIEQSGWASIGIGVLAILGLMTFLYRATVNARRWDPAISHAPYMAIVGYVIPFCNAVIPWLVLRQAMAVGARRAGRAAGSWLVVVWAVCQTAGVAGRVVYGGRYERLDDALVPDFGAARSTIQALGVSSALLAAGFAVGIATVLRVAALHDRPATA